MLFAPTVEEYGSLSVADLIEFLDAGLNILVAASSAASETVRELGAAVGVDLDEAGSAITDHMHFDTSSGAQDHTLVLSSNYNLVPGLFSSRDAFARQGKPVAFRGIGMAVADDNILAMKILSGAPTSYSAPLNAAPQGEHPQAGGESLLVAAIQARNNARITFAGSLFMFSNEAFALKSASNAAFVAAASDWTFRGRGVLRASGVRHAKADGTPPATQLSRGRKENLPTSMYPDPEVAPDSLVYRIKDYITYEVTIEEYADGAWKAFSAKDVQLEFVMLDPYIRTTLETDGSGVFSKTFMTPDVYGIYKFRIQYRREGYSTLHLSNQVSIRPFKHNEYERFIFSAYPYYTGAFSMMAGFFVFSVAFLYHRD